MPVLMYKKHTHIYTHAGYAYMNTYVCVYIHTRTHAHTRIIAWHTTHRQPIVDQRQHIYIYTHIRTYTHMYIYALTDNLLLTSDSTVMEVSVATLGMLLSILLSTIRVRMSYKRQIASFNETKLL